MAMVQEQTQGLSHGSDHAVSVGLSEPPHKSDSYSVPAETLRVFKEGLLANPLFKDRLPANFQACADAVEFTGSDEPSIPINWRFAESVSALKGLEATYINALLGQKYNLPPQKIVIDVDHATLFIMSTVIYTIDPRGTPIDIGKIMSDRTGQVKARFDSMFKDCDKYGMVTGMYRGSATNIYKTKDNRHFHLHGSLNPTHTITMLGLPPNKDVATPEEGLQPFIDAVGALDSQELQTLASEKYKQSGTICLSPTEYAESEHGKANAHVGLWELERYDYPAQKPGWWTSPLACPERPLAGLKVLDVTRIIAAPAITRGMAELGASVLRITGPHLPDATSLHCDLNWGKWNAELDFRDEAQRERMRELILEADVFVHGYRPGVMDKWGFGVEEVLEMCKTREKGIIIVRENCYGWHGPWQGRSGWQQISDACCGVSMEFGRAMGNDEPVTPVFPNSDYCTGIAGVCGVLEALMRRGSEGGSYKVDVALNYYSRWLVDSVGTYPPAVWQDLWSRNGSQVFRHYHTMLHLLPRYMGMIMKTAAAKLFKPSFLEERPCKILGVDIKTVKPVLQFPDGIVKLGFNVGTRGNGVDKARWPEDLTTESII